MIDVLEEWLRSDVLKSSWEVLFKAKSRLRMSDLVSIYVSVEFTYNIIQEHMSHQR